MRARAARAPLALAAFLAALLAAVSLPASAGALVTEVAGAPKVGLQPRSDTLGTAGAEPELFGNESGNAVLTDPSEYAIYWDPEKAFHHEWVTNLDEFFANLGEAGLGTPFATLPQYRDRANTVSSFHATFKGAYSDTSRFPSAGCSDPNPLETGQVTCLTDAQLRAQLQSFIAARGLPKGMSTIYYVLTPPGVTVCLNAAATSCSDYEISPSEAEKDERASASYASSFCSYHSDIDTDEAPEGDGSTILYVAIPWTAGMAGMEGERYVPSGDPQQQVAYESAYDCQDGGWNAEGNEEQAEQEPPLTPEEKSKLEAASSKEKRELEEERALQGPHIEEPNQEGKGEYGDYAPGLTDVLIDQIGEEEMNTVTDPLLNAWQDPSGDEATDMCRNVFANTGSEGVTGSPLANVHTKAGTLANMQLGAAHYFINNVFNLSSFILEGVPCAGAVGLVPRFTAPNPVNAGEVVGVDGMESTVSEMAGEAFGLSGPPTRTYSTFSWNFGDGTPEVTGYAPGAPTCETPWISPCAASAFHTYQYGGKYEVTLTITDVAGNTASVTHSIVVNGPPRPSSVPAAAPAASAAASEASGAAAGGSSAAPGAGSGGKASVAAPVAVAEIVRQSLRTAARKGLVVSYSVNEQVAGHFEVLLSRASARRLGIGGAPATGLPAGSPSELVIAKALLVTTKGGRSAVHIQFSKHTGARLARAGKVALMLRLVVHNAATSNPASTAVITSATLAR